jgi:hypothetical protein
MRWHPVAAVGLAGAAILVVGAAWQEDVPELTAADAVDAAEGALRGAGLDATVEPDPLPTVYASATRDPVAVWSVRATVRAEPISLQLARAGAQPVALDDRTLDGSAYVLSDFEYRSVVDHVDDPARQRTLERNVVLTLAALLVVAMAVALAAQAPRKEPR